MTQSHQILAALKAGEIHHESPELLRILLKYEPDTGNLFWKERPEFMFTCSAKRPRSHNANMWNKKWAGRPALACPSGAGHLMGRVFRRALFAHRAAWSIHYGTPPQHNIDHIDGCPTNNAINNLRDVTQAVNVRNRAISPTANNTGVMGVCFSSGKQKWHARIRHDGTHYHLGYFDDFSRAVEARLEAEKRFGFGPSHGNLKQAGHQIHTARVETPSGAFVASYSMEAQA